MFRLFDEDEDLFLEEFPLLERLLFEDERFTLPLLDRLLDERFTVDLDEELLRVRVTPDEDERLLIDRVTPSKAVLPTTLPNDLKNDDDRFELRFSLLNRGEEL